MIEHVEPCSEEWRPVPGHEGRYEVSSKGRVRSLDRIAEYVRRDQYSGRDIAVSRRHKGRNLRPAPSATGHMSVVLGRGMTTAVHVLVLKAFGPAQPIGTETCHANGDPSDNRIENLRWGTRSENLLDAVAHGVRPIGSRTHMAKLLESDIPRIRDLIGKRTIVSIASEYGVNEATIRQIRDGRSWKHVRSGHAV